RERHFNCMPSPLGFSMLFFFFQAEDGIRDFHVTGVQTCALPISNHVEYLLTPPSKDQLVNMIRDAGLTVREVLRKNVDPYTELRSEERRVGKEGRTGWAMDQRRKKTSGSGVGREGKTNRRRVSSR